MALKFYNETTELKTECLTAVIFGEPGMGKSSLANTAKDVLALDFDKGMQRAIIKQHYVRIERWEDVEDLKKSADFANLKPKTLVIDTVGTMLDNYIADYVKRQDPKNARRGGELSLNGYGAMKNTFKQFQDWAQIQNINLIFVAHATSKEEGDNSKYIPKLTGGSYDILRESTDLIGYMYSNQNKRVIDFTPRDSHVGKDCANIGLIEVPLATSDEYQSFMEDLIQRTLKRMNDITEQQAKIIDIIKEYREVISKIKNAGEANTMIDMLQDSSKTVQIQCFKDLKKHCNSFAQYDIETKKFKDKEA